MSSKGALHTLILVTWIIELPRTRRLLFGLNNTKENKFFDDCNKQPSLYFFIFNVLQTISEVA